MRYCNDIICICSSLLLGGLGLSTVCMTLNSQALEKSAGVGVRKIIIVRHGESLHNLKSVYNANPNHSKYSVSTLTKTGVAQVRASGLKIRKILKNRSISAIYTSPLPRTVQTAEELASILAVPRNRINEDIRLIESQLGERENENIYQFGEKDPWFPENPKVFGGETAEEVSSRMLACFNEVKTLSTHGDIILVTHGAPALLLIKAVTKGGQDTRLKTAGFFVLEIPKES